MQNIVLCLYRTYYRFYVFIYTEAKFYENIYEKVDMIKFWKLMTIFKISTLLM